MTLTQLKQFIRASPLNAQQVNLIMLKRYYKKKSDNASLHTDLCNRIVKIPARG